MKDQEEEIEEEEEEVLDFTYSITSYGADYPVDGLVKRLRQSKIKTPKFQRSFVWSQKQASRFIESLLLGLPVPGIFLSKDMESADLLVIDGQQRLKSLLYFYDESINERTFRLLDVQERFEGKTYTELSTDDKTRLDDSIIHATIVKQDEPSEDNSSIYFVFERLNTGGMLLQPQEIRAAIYPGKFNDLLKKLNSDKRWREIYGNQSIRLKDQEFILRFFAFYFYKDKYTKPLKKFLNTYMAKNKELKFNSEKQLKQTFEMVIEFISKTLGKNAFRPVRSINASVFDSVMVGIAERLKNKSVAPSKKAFMDAYKELLKNKVYINATTDATSDEPVVDLRMQLAIDQFKKI